MVECSSSLDVSLVNVGCYVSAADTVTVRLFNGTAGTIDLASSTWRAFVFPKGVHVVELEPAGQHGIVAYLRVKIEGQVRPIQ